jgi:hypothetical protein
MAVKVQLMKGNDVPQNLFNFINKSRIKEYGDKVNLFSKRHHRDTYFFFVKENGKIVTFGLLRNIDINYIDKNYNILGIGGILSVEKGKGYGKILIKSMIKFLKKKNKTGLGFCGQKKKIFYKKAGLKVKDKLNQRFIMKNPKTGELIKDPDGFCPGIYYEGKDKLISKVLKTRSKGYYWLDDIKDPHW